MLAKDRRFTVAAVVALALGIGVNNSVFAIINTLWFKDVPFDEPDRLVSLSSVDPSGRDRGLSYLDIHDISEGSTVFAGLAANLGGVMNVSGDEEQPPERFRGSYVSANTFGLLRSQPLLGRTFLPEDDRPGAPAVVILGHATWLGRYGADSSVIGRTIKVNDVPSIVIGVMPQGFTFPFIAELWQPLVFAPGLANERREMRNLSVVGRLADSADLAQARSSLETIAGRLATEYPQTNKDVRLSVRRLKDSRPDATSMLMTMMGAVGFVLLIACANLANLMLARSAGRAREIAIRASLGATRWRIVRQLLIECVLLSALAGVLGLLFSLYGAREIAIAFNPIEAGTPLQSTKPYWVDVTMDGIMYAFLGGLCLFASVAFGLLPALHISKTNVHDTLKESGRGTTGVSARRWTGALMVVELALTLVLLTGAGLLWRNFLATYQTDILIDTSGLVTMQLALPVQKYGTPGQAKQFFERLDERLGAIPTVTSVTMASQAPFGAFPASPRQLAIAGRGATPGQAPQGVTYVFVGDRYFETLGLGILRGRAFSEGDSFAGQEGAVVNQRLATLFFADDDPLGRSIQLTGPTPATPPTPWLTIVGVAATLPRPGRPREPDPVVYVPVSVDPAPRVVSVLARGSAGLAAVAAALRSEVRALDSDLPLYGIETMDDVLARTSLGTRIVGTWFGVLAMIALVVASVGLYALTAHGVAQRTQEIGVRMALGADAPQVMWLFVRRTFVHLVFGLALGVAGWLAVGHLLAMYFGQISQRDPLTIAAVTALLIVVAGTASVLPARRAARVDPAVALRAD